MKRLLLFGRKAMTNQDSISKSRDMTLPVNLHSQNYSFSSSHVGKWELDNREGEPQNALELWYWRRLSRFPWTARRWNQSILKEINTEYSLEGLMLKLQYFGHLIPRANSLEKTLMLGKIEGNKGWDGWMASPTQWTWVWANSRR